MGRRPEQNNTKSIVYALETMTGLEKVVIFSPKDDRPSSFNHLLQLYKCFRQICKPSNSIAKTKHLMIAHSGGIFLFSYFSQPLRTHYKRISSQLINEPARQKNDKLESDLQLQQPKKHHRSLDNETLNEK